ncbi:MAG: tetratricopeptide repeat protein [Sedimentisphaerales bacterium]|nr:tetratricopeptide repeat protein [Sedimentisphaerales bacterium]
MNNPENNKWLDKELSESIGSEKLKPDFEQWKKEHPHAVETLTSRAKDTNVSKRPYNIRNIIMKSPITKLASAAVILFIVGLSITVFSWLTAPAWAFGQTIKAIKDTNNVVIRGTINSDSNSIPFTFWVKFSDDAHKTFDTCFDCEEEKVVTNGYKAWVLKKKENRVNIFDDVRTCDGMMRDMGLWYKLSEEYPWISGTILSSIKHIADNWDETYGVDEQTGRDSVFVTCRFKKLSVSLWFVCDIKTKLITEGKFWNWRQTDTQEIPKYHAASFTYNEKIDEGLFDFQIPEGALINGQNEADILFGKAEKLFHEEKKYTEALESYKHIYETYPDLNNGTYGSNALMMIGICYGRLNQPEKGIEAFLKLIEEYEPWATTYFYLGCAYLDAGQKEKALKAYENCLKVGEGERDPDKFPLKNAREAIEKLKTKD